jgi:hypothetical protein
MADEKHIITRSIKLSPCLIGYRYIIECLATLQLKARHRGDEIALDQQSQRVWLRV